MFKTLVQNLGEAIAYLRNVSSTYMLLIPYLQIRSNSIISYTLNEDRPYRRSIQAELTKNLTQQCNQDGVVHTPYDGTMHAGTKKRLIKAIDFMVEINKERTIYNPVTHRKQPFRVGFLTLTIGSARDRLIGGKEGHKKLLEPFIKWMKQVHGVKSYLWKAELQKRGQIHYHLTIDQFIHWRAIRTKWNELQRRGGYIDGYFKRYGHYDPNSVDIHSVQKVTSLGYYLKKEIAKSFQNDKSLDGKVWDCSLNLKKAKWFTVNESMSYAYSNELQRANQLRVVPTDHCYIYEFLNQPAANFLDVFPTMQYRSAYESHLETIRNYERKRPDKQPVYVHPEIVLVEFNKKPPDLFHRYIDLPCEVVINSAFFGSN